MDDIVHRARDFHFPLKGQESWVWVARVPPARKYLLRQNLGGEAFYD